jgi:hypothetical protein
MELTRQKNREIAGCFDGHADVAVRCGAHCPMEHIPGFIRSHRMPSLGKCLCCNALAAAMADDVDCKHKNTNKKLYFS